MDNSENEWTEINDHAGYFINKQCHVKCMKKGKGYNNILEVRHDGDGDKVRLSDGKTRHYYKIKELFAKTFGTVLEKDEVKPCFKDVKINRKTGKYEFNGIIFDSVDEAKKARDEEKFKHIVPIIIPKQYKDLPDQEWYIVEEFPFYEINKQGIVRYIHNKEIINSRNDKEGYPFISCGGTTRRVSRLLAITFIENPRNLPEVNHINGIKNDYRLQNLEWVSSSENSHKRDHKKDSKPRNKNGNQFFACSTIDGIRWNLGYFKTEEEKNKAKEDFELKHLGYKCSFTDT